MSEFLDTRLERGLEAAWEANRQYDILQRVEAAARESEEPSPEGVSPAEARSRFNVVVIHAGLLIGRRSDAVMTDDGLVIPDQT